MSVLGMQRAYYFGTLSLRIGHVFSMSASSWLRTAAKLIVGSLEQTYMQHDAGRPSEPCVPLAPMVPTEALPPGPRPRHLELWPVRVPRRRRPDLPRARRASGAGPSTMVGLPAIVGRFGVQVNVMTRCLYARLPVEYAVFACWMSMPRACLRARHLCSAHATCSDHWRPLSHSPGGGARGHGWTPVDLRRLQAVTPRLEQRVLGCGKGGPRESSSAAPYLQESVSHDLPALSAVQPNCWDPITPAQECTGTRTCARAEKQLL